MAKASDGPIGDSAPLGALIADAATRRGPPPVHLWDPPDCGDIPMRIARDGTWHYRGTPVARPALVRLFASVLRREGDRHVLVTPVEKVGIEVEDAPFLAVELAEADGVVRLRTNVDDWVEIGPEHPLRFEPGPAGALRPYALVRGGLWALVGRGVFYEMVERGETAEAEGRAAFGLRSGASFFPMMEAAALDAFLADPALGAPTGAGDGGPSLPLPDSDVTAAPAPVGTLG